MWKIALVVVAAFVGFLLLRRPPGETVEADEARALVARGATLLDVRSSQEFAGGHPEGAINIPVSELAGRLAELPREKPVVVYCLSGGRSASAARRLRAEGLEVHDVGAIANY